MQTDPVTGSVATSGAPCHGTDASEQDFHTGGLMIPYEQIRDEVNPVVQELCILRRGSMHMIGRYDHDNL
jgi:hypothetical protein